MRAASLYSLLGLAVILVGVAAWFALAPPGTPAPAPAPEPRRGEEPGPGEESEGLHAVAGRVEDEAGRPVAGAVVYLLPPDDPRIPTEAPFRGRSGEDGGFRLRSPEGERRDLFAWRPGYRPALVETVTRTEELRVVLARGGEIRGVTVNDLGRPVAGVRITARSAGWGYEPPRGRHLPTHATFDRTWARTLSGLDGSFTLRGLGDEPMEISFTKKGYPEGLPPPAEVRPGEEVELVLLRPFRVELTALQAVSREPLRGISVEITAPEGDWGPMAGHTDHRGVLRIDLPFPAVRAREVAVDLSLHSRQLGGKIVTGVELSALAEGRGFVITLSRREDAKLRVQVLYDTGKPYRQWGVFLVKPRGAPVRREWARIEKGGWAELELPPGSYESLKISNGVGEVTDLVLHSGRMTEATLIVRRGGDLRVEVKGEGKEEPRQGTVRVTTEQTDDTRGFWRGRTRFIDIPPGRANVRVEADGFEPVEQEVEIVKGEEQALKVTLPRKTRVR